MYSIPRRNLQISKPPKLPAAKATQPIIGDSKHPESARARLEQLHEATCAHYEKILQECRDRFEEDEEGKK